MHAVSLMIQHIIYFTSSFSFQLFVGFDGRAARFMAFASFVVLLPMSQPHPLSILTTLGVIAAVRGTRMKIKDLWIA